MSVLYLNDHESQYQVGASARTRSSGCTWTAGANGVDAVTGGRYDPSPDKILSLLDRDEETSPATPGWSLVDLDTALGRFGMAFDNLSGSGFGSVLSTLDDDRYVVLQGDSDQFSDGTCSGNFDGDHAIGVHPRSKTEAGVRWRWINDPICPRGRWERESVLRRYAQKFSATCRFGAFRQRVPRIEAPRPPDTSAGGDMATAVRSEDRVIASDSVVRVKAGAKLYRDEGKTVVRTLDESALLDDFGVFVGASAYRAVRLVAGHFDNDGDPEGGIALVKDRDVSGGPRPKTVEELAATAARFR